MTGNIKTNGNNIDFGSTGKAKNVYELTGERITLTSSDDETIQTLKVRNDRIDFFKDTDYKTDDDGNVTEAKSAAYIDDGNAIFNIPIHIYNNNITVQGRVSCDSLYVGDGLTVQCENDAPFILRAYSGNNDVPVKVYQKDGVTENGGIYWSATNGNYIWFKAPTGDTLYLNIDSDGKADIKTTKQLEVQIAREQRFYADDAMTKIRNANAKNITLDDDKGIYVCGDILLFENAENCDHLPEDVTEDETTYLDNYLQNIIIDLKRRIEVLEGAETAEETTE